MLGRIVDIAEYRNRRASEAAASLRAFGRLPCPRCACGTEASSIVDGGARFVCDAGHAEVCWTYDGMGGVVIDGKKRRFIAGWS